MRPAAAPLARRQRGWSTFETMVAIGIISTGLMVLVQQMSISFRESNTNDNRAFAYQKASALLGEIQNSITLGRVVTSDDLYALVDTKPNPVLTTRRDAEGLPFLPEHPMSGNSKRTELWRWERRLSVTPHENTGLYYCRVQIDRVDDDGHRFVEASQAQLFSLLPSAESPEQVHDVYLLACAEVPSLWADLGELEAHATSASNTVAGKSQARLRLHWIRRLGYGRDPCYAPFVNTVRTADDYAPFAYWLPGALGGAHTGSQLYHSDLLPGMHRTELGLVHGQTAEDPFPATVADLNNHCLRTPAAWRLFDQRVAAGLEDPDAPPLQLLLDDMSLRPERYRNAIFVNLHGRGLPLPPLRNYSDAAKDPLGRPGVRVVTHPSRLWTPRDPNGNGDHADTQEVELRVYGWRTEGTGDVLDEPILVQIFGADLTGEINGGATSTLRVLRLAGGIDTETGVASDKVPYVPFDAPEAEAPQSGKDREMRFEAGYAGGARPYTWLRLYNTPLVAPPADTGGLLPDARLYGCDYVPSPVAGSFAQDLATASEGSLLMRNTARWRIRIPAQVFVSGKLPNTDQVVRVQTRIGTNLATGQRWPTSIEPLNLSETWTWWSRSPTAVPVTERAQFLGDPRCCPYEDLMATGTAFPHGYNWHFDDLQEVKQDAQPLWPCFDAARLHDGFASGPREDVPRLLQLLRNALQGCGAVFVAPVDELANTVLLGGEIALPTATGTTGIALHANYTAGGQTTVDTITPVAGGGRLVLHREAAPSWWARPWLGELFPDDQADIWLSDGNVKLGAPGLRWSPWQQANLPSLPYGTTFTAPVGATTGAAGGLVLVNKGSATSAFLMPLAAETPLIADVAAEAINAATNLVPPRSWTSARTVSLTASVPDAPPAFAFTDSYPRSITTELETEWKNNNGHAGSTIAWTGTGTAFLVPWNAPTSAGAAREVMVQAMLLGLRGLHAAGHPAVVGRIAQLPQLEIIEPVAGSNRMDPDAMTVRWQTQWLRFDGKSYTDSYPVSFAQSESELVYRVLWSGDTGVTWTSATTDQPTKAGVWPEQPTERLNDAGTGSESFTFPLPGGLPAGEYLFLVEAWRLSTHEHCSTHQVRIFVRSSM